MPAQTYPETSSIPLIACTACEKKPLMVIKSVSPKGRTRDADVTFVCTTCGATRTEPTSL